MYRDHIKRLLDLILSLGAAVVLAIPMGLLALWVKLDSPGPVFFRQRRVGAGKTHFNILKFRLNRDKAALYSRYASWPFFVPLKKGNK